MPPRVVNSLGISRSFMPRNRLNGTLASGESAAVARDCLTASESRYTLAPSLCDVFWSIRSWSLRGELMFWKTHVVYKRKRSTIAGVKLQSFSTL